MAKQKLQRELNPKIHSPKSMIFEGESKLFLRSNRFFEENAFLKTKVYLEGNWVLEENVFLELEARGNNYKWERIFEGERIV